MSTSRSNVDTGQPLTNLEQARRSPVTFRRASLWRQARMSFVRHWQLYLMMVPGLLYFIVFKYVPIVNAVIAFKDYRVTLGIWGSPWVGFKHFLLFLENPVFETLLKNTLGLSLYALIVSFPIPIILALCLNEIRDGLFKRTVQFVTYAPFFISTVIMVSMIIQLLSPRLGIVNTGLEAMGFDLSISLGNQNYSRRSMSGQGFGRIADMPQLCIWRHCQESILNCMKPPK